jgi:hypothetical protein
MIARAWRTRRPTWWTRAYEDAVRIGLLADAEQIWVTTSPRSAVLAATTARTGQQAQSTERTAP